MRKDLPLLNNLEVAKPCPANWDDMRGDDRVRHCSDCKLDVYNVSEMTPRQAEEFLRQASGRICLRFYRRADGTIITRDCPVGLARVRKKVVHCLNALVALLWGASYLPIWTTTTGDASVSSTLPSEGHSAVNGRVATSSGPPSEDLMMGALAKDEPTHK
jgi:hypothetical protein